MGFRIICKLRPSRVSGEVLKVLKFQHSWFGGLWFLIWSTFWLQLWVEPMGLGFRV